MLVRTAKDSGTSKPCAFEQNRGFKEQISCKIKVPTNNESVKQTRERWKFKIDHLFCLTIQFMNYSG
jgi:hypothetical protein